MSCGKRLYYELCIMPYMAQRSGRQRAIMRYKEAEPDITTSGIGRNYKGFRIFHTIKTDDVEYIANDGAIRPATADEVDQFRKDLASAARKNAEIGKYISKFPLLQARENSAPDLKPELKPELKTELKPEPEGIQKTG